MSAAEQVQHARLMQEKAAEVWKCFDPDDFDPEEGLQKLAEWLRLDAARCEHPVVVATLTGAAESCDAASFAYYASLK